MKNTILLTFLASVLSVSAASIDWTMNTGIAKNNYMVDADGNKLNGVAYLMLTDSLSGVTFTSQDEIVDLSLGKAGVTITDGINKATTTTTDDRLTAPDSYSFTVLVFDAAKSTYYLSAAKTQDAYNLSGDEYTDPKSITLSNDNMFASAATRGTQTWTAVGVPEPSSAMLGLLGLGLLLKRRKA